ncbi:MAG: hypothetical protein GX087_13070 [Desulfobulbaceae bacterium]|nr:hypothetical protein [Desulfobulbaceae bacterium]
MEKIIETDGVEIRTAIANHIVEMLRQATEALEDTAVIQWQMEEKTPWVFGEPKADARTFLDIKELEGEIFEQCCLIKDQ